MERCGELYVIFCVEFLYKDLSNKQNYIYVTEQWYIFKF